MPRGIRKKLADDRALVSDIVEIARRMPLAPLIREIDLSVVEKARKSVRSKISWTALMMKAYSLVAAERPELRQVYVPFPWPHIYQHPENVAMLTVTRNLPEGPRLFFARFAQPENQTLVEIQQRFGLMRRSPINKVKQFRHQKRFARWPKSIRRIAWWSMKNLMPAKLVQQIGTFGMSLSQLDTSYGVYHLGPTATTLGYEHFANNNKMRISLTFDHRILDGKHVYDILNDLESQLHGPVLDELYMMRDGIDVLNPDPAHIPLGAIEILPYRKAA